MGDAALLVMKPDEHLASDIESHVRETERHFPIGGSALFYVGGSVRLVNPGDYIEVPPFTPHFIVTVGDSDYVSLVVSSPGFDPNNLVSLSGDSEVPEEALAARNTYDHITAALGGS